MEVRSHHLAVSRTARYCTVGDALGAKRMWLVCHGYGQLAADFLSSFGAAAAPGLLIVAPEALSRFYVEDRVGPHGPESRVGATWMTREDRLVEIDDYVRYLDGLYAHLKGALVGDRGDTALPVLALGFSQGAATVARWAARTEAPVDELVLWGAGLPPELDPHAVAARWQHLRVTLVCGTRDRWWGEGALRADEERLRAAGVRTRVLSFQGGHRLDDATLVRLAEEENATP